MAYAFGLINIDAKDAVFADLPFHVPNFNAFRAGHTLGCLPNSLKFHVLAVRETCAFPQIKTIAANKKVGSRPLGTSTSLRATTSISPHGQIAQVMPVWEQIRNWEGN